MAVSDNVWLLLTMNNDESVCKAEYEEVVVLQDIVNETHGEDTNHDNKITETIHTDLLESCIDM